MYEIVGKIGREVVSRHYTINPVYAEQVRELGSIRLLNGYILKLEVKQLDEKPINNYVGWIKKCAEYGVYDCKDIPEFE